MIQQKYLFTQRINIKLVLPITVHIVHCVHCTVYNEKRIEKEEESKVREEKEK